jgi:hypothetical protein
MSQEIGEALDKFKISSWNSSDWQIYEGEVQEVITYFDELERHRMEGLEGMWEWIIKKLHFQWNFFDQNRNFSTGSGIFPFMIEIFRKYM